jgi:hypothetical protein
MMIKKALWLPLKLKKRGANQRKCRFQSKNDIVNFANQKKKHLCFPLYNTMIRSSPAYSRKKNDIVNFAPPSESY